MGQEIVYCYKCQKRILGAEFGKGRAYQFGHRVCCADCAPALLETLDGAERADLIEQMYKAIHNHAASLGLSSNANRPAPDSTSPLRTTSSTRVKSTQGGADRRKTTAHLPILRLRPSGAGPSGLALGGAVGVVALLVIAALWMAVSGGSPSREERRASLPPAPAPTVRRPEAPALAPEEAKEFALARAALEQARAFESAHPRDFESLVTRWQEAVRAVGETPFLREAKRELDRVWVGRAEAVRNDLAALDGRAGPLIRAEDFKAAAELFQASRAKYDLSEWTTAIDRRSRESYDAAAQLYPPLRASAVSACKAGRAADVEAARSRVRKWNFPEFTTDLGSALAAATPEAPIPPPKPRSIEVEAYDARWHEALGKASLRDYAGATEELRRAGEPLSQPEARAEAAADLEAFRAAQSVLQDSLDLMSRSPRGQKLSVARWNGSGGCERIEGVVLGVDGTRVLVKEADFTEPLELGEITPASLAEVYGSRPQKNPGSDPRAAALFCLVEGDPEAARVLAKGSASTIPEKYWSAGVKTAQERRRGEAAEKEASARNLFYQAEAGLTDYSKTTIALPLYKSLLADYSGTAFVSRNRAAITRRLGGGREYVFFADGMKASGSFGLSRSGKLEACWASSRDSEPSKMPENYVELTYSTLPDLEYRCWILAGACCLETFETGVQAAGLKCSSARNSKETVSAEPGSPYALMLKPTLSLKKSHAMHGGPKMPARWEWIPVPLPKDPAPGVRSVRILTDQKGFAVAAAVVSAHRTGPPTESELKELERLRIRNSALSGHDPSLQGHWKLDEGEGIVASDSSGSGQGGSLANDPSWVVGAGDRALSFNGINQYVDLGTCQKLNAAGSFTVAARVNPAALGGQPRYIFADYIEHGDSSAFALRLEPSGQASFFWEYPSAVEPKAFSKTRCATGTWVHLAGVWDGSTRKIYVNGVFDGSDATSQERPTRVSSVAIGRPGAYNGFYASGLIRDVRFYSRVLSDPEIAALAKGVRNPAAPASTPGHPADGAWVTLFGDSGLAGWEGIAGTPRLEGGVLILEGNNAEIQRPFGGADFELEGSVYVLPDAKGHGGSIAFRRAPGTQRVPPYITFYGDGDVHALDDGGSTTRADGGRIPARTWHAFVLRVVGAELTFAADGKQILRTTVTRRSSGNLALYSQEPTSTIKFKDLRIRELR